MFDLGEADRMEGHKFESYIGVMFAKLGFKSLVTKGSGDQGVDVIVKTTRESYAIQTKCFQNALSNKPIQEIVACKTFYKCDNAVVITNAGYTNSALELAQSVNVELWDWKKLDIIFGITNSILAKVGTRTKTEYDEIDTDSLFTRVLLEALKYDIRDKRVSIYKNELVISSRVDRDETIPTANVNRLISDIKMFIKSNADNVSPKLLKLLQSEIDNGEMIDETMVKLAIRQLNARSEDTNDEDDEALEEADRVKLCDAVEKVL